MAFVLPLAATVLAGCLILLVPGLALISLTARGRALALVDRLAFGAAVSWCVVTMLCVLSFVLAWDVGRASAVLLALDAILVAWFLYRTPWRRVSAPRAAHWLALIGLLAVSLLAFKVGGYTDPRTGPTVGVGWSTMEELLQISTARKVAESPALRVDRVMYVKGELPTYYYPVYPFALALMTRVSGLDPVVLFDTFRLWTGLLALIALASIANGAFGKAASAAVMAIAIGLVLIGQAGSAPGLGSWGQLLPVSHIGDFGLGVLLPLALALTVRLAVGEPGDEFATLIAIPFFAAVAVTHTRESAHLASYLVALLAIGPLVGALDRRRWLRLAGATTALLLFTMAYSAQVQEHVPFIREHEQAAAARARIASVTMAGSLQPADVPPVLRPYVTMAFIAGPLVLILWRRSAGVVLLAAGLVCWWLPLHVPWVAHLLERAVYSEIMTSPSRYVFHVAYLFYAIVVFAALRGLDHYLPTGSPVRATVWKVVAAPTTAIVLVALPELLEAAAGRRPLLMIVMAAALALLGARSAAGAMARTLVQAPAPLRHPGWIYATAALVFAGLLARSDTPTLLAAAQKREWSPSAATETWYQQAAIRETLPWSAVRMLRERIPARSVIAADPALGLAIPLMTDQFILVSGTNFSTDLHYLQAVGELSGPAFDPARIDWAAYETKLGSRLTPAVRDDVTIWEHFMFRQQQLVSLSSPGRQPLFSEDEAPETTARLFRLLAPDYVLVSPAINRRLAALVDRHPNDFEHVADAAGFRLFRVNRLGPLLK